MHAFVFSFLRYCLIDLFCVLTWPGTSCHVTRRAPGGLAALACVWTAPRCLAPCSSWTGWHACSPCSTWCSSCTSRHRRCRCSGNNEKVCEVNRSMNDCHWFRCVSGEYSTLRCFKYTLIAFSENRTQGWCRSGGKHRICIRLCMCFVVCSRACWACFFSNISICLCPADWQKCLVYRCKSSTKAAFAHIDVFSENECIATTGESVLWSFRGRALHICINAGN